MKNILILLLILSSGCEEAFFPDGCKDIIIEQGQHFPNGSIELIDRLPVKTADMLKYNAKFETHYRINDIDSSDWNKMPGLSYTKLPSHFGEYGFDLVTFGFRFNHEKQCYEICAFANDEGDIVLKEYLYDVVEWNYTIVYEIIQDDRNVYFSIMNLYDENILSSFTWKKPTGKHYGYVTGWYFGGNKPAPIKQKYRICYY